MKNNKSSVSGKYIIFVGLVSFTIAAIFFSLSEFLSQTLNSLTLSFIFLIIIILTGILADIVGTAVAASNETPFHAKSSKRVKGARECVYLIRNADRVANICCDVVGDIAGTVSGALGIALALQIITLWQEINHFTLNMMLTALIAALTVGGKGFGKKIALSRPNEVIFFAGRVIAAFNGIKGIRMPERRGE